MKNFVSLIDQLEQKYLTLFCGEGVYRIISYIYLKRAEEFQKYIPIVGEFPCDKITSTLCGLENALVETKQYEKKVPESV